MTLLIGGSRGYFSCCRDEKSEAQGNKWFFLSFLFIQQTLMEHLQSTQHNPPPLPNVKDNFDLPVS